MSPLTKYHSLCLYQMQSATMLLTVFDREKFHCHPCLLYHTPTDLIKKHAAHVQNASSC